MKSFKVTLADGREFTCNGFYIDEALRNAGLTKDDLKGKISITQL